MHADPDITWVGYIDRQTVRVSQSLQALAGMRKDLDDDDEYYYYYYYYYWGCRSCSLLLAVPDSIPSFA